MRTILFACLLAFLGTPGSAQEPSPWRDPSKHQVKFVTVDGNVRLEVVDWGGSGRPLVLLAGSGNTAHVFDGFAEKLTGNYHVYGVTRRGYGASSYPESGYGDKRLADDVLDVLDLLHLTKPVLAGHSMGGHEAAVVAAAHPDRLAGLVIMDSTADPTFDWSPYEELRKGLPAAMNAPAGPPVDGTFQAYRDWQQKNSGIAFPESELRSCFATKPDGTMGAYRTAKGVGAAITAGSVKLNFSAIHVPVLAFYVLPAPLENQLERFKPKDAGERTAMEQVYAADVSFSRRTSGSLKRSVPGARIFEMPGANHYLFLSNAADVLREMRAFTSEL